MHRLLPFLLLILAVIPSSRHGIRPVLGRDARMTATPVPLDPGDPVHVRVGALTYLGGVRLTSPDPAFGSFSAMLVAGDRFTLVSDAGNIVRFRMGGDWKPFDLSFADLAEGPATQWSKRDRDVESLAADPASGRIWAGFEDSNSIWRYDSDLVHAQRSARPPGMADWGYNGGPESLVRMREGGFVAIAETARLRGVRGRAALRFAGDPTEAPGRAFAFAYVPPAGYDPSDAVQLPDGRLLVLNRRVAPGEMFTARLTLVETAAIRPRAVASGREIAAIGPPLTRDNFEAMAVTREAGRTILWIASDDNGAWYQQSLLMKFRLELPAR
ncbi:MAG: esterase-like activity of phytase family protein [Sphingomonas sp.]